MDLFSLKGKTAIVTGGSRGLGLGLTEGLASAGAKVVITSSSDGIFSAAEEFRKKGFDVIGMKCDLSADQATIEAAFHKAVEELGGKLDILVNNAGVQHFSNAEEFPMDAWDNIFYVNMRSLFLLCQLAGKYMLAEGSGKIINIASMTSFFGSVTVPAYAASKGGVAQLTKALGNEWASRGVNVNAIAPGYMHTDMTAPRRANEASYNAITTRIPAARWGQPEDMMGSVIFLASRASDYLSGVILPVDGGYLVR